MSSEHVVKTGECVSSIAFATGFFPGTIWDDPANADLKALRQDMNILNPGDVLVIPDKRPKEATGDTGRVHRYKLRGMPIQFVLRLTNGDEPLAGLSYELQIDDKTHTGETDADGGLEHWIPPNSKRGVLRVAGEEYPFQLGTLQPATTEDGVRDRLQNLAYLEPNSGDAGLRAAIRAFKRKHCPDSPEPHDELTEADRAKLVEIHGS